MLYRSTTLTLQDKYDIVACANKQFHRWLSEKSVVDVALSKPITQLVIELCKLLQYVDLESWTQSAQPISNRDLSFSLEHVLQLQNEFCGWFAVMLAWPVHDNHVWPYPAFVSTFSMHEHVHIPEYESSESIVDLTSYDTANELFVNLKVYVCQVGLKLGSLLARPLLENRGYVELCYWLGLQLRKNESCTASMRQLHSPTSALTPPAVRTHTL